MVLYEDIARYLLSSELESLQRVQLLQPWDRIEDPFEFSANPATGAMLIPTFSVKFLDDLAIATAWFERFECNKESVFDYVAAMDYSSLKLPAPLKALKVPDKAYTLDDFVDDVSQKILKSAMAFIFLHELGHIHHQHLSYDKISPAEAQAQEAEADLFAMQVLRRMRLPPMGMTVWFMAISMRDPLAPGSPRQKHPLTSSRLNAIAEELRKRPTDFIEPANKGIFTADTILSIAEDINGIGRMLEDPNLRSFLRERGRIVTSELLGNACQAEQHDQDWLQRFNYLLEE
jgi:hypothetical protein